MDNLGHFLKLAGQQHGVIARFQLIEKGFSPSSIHRHLNSSTFQRIHRGTFKGVGTIDTWHQQATIAVLANGPGTLLSHTSALKNLELIDKNFDDRNVIRKRFQRELNLFHLVSNREIRNNNNYFIHRSLSIDKSGTKNLVNGIPQVTIERAIIDSGTILSDYFLDTVVFQAIRRNLTSYTKLKIELQKSKVAPGRSKENIREIIHQYKDNGNGKERIESILEKRVYDLLTSTFNIEIKSQYEIFINGRYYRVDFAIPKEQIIIEADGHEFHSSRAQLDSDRRRQNDIISQGWKVLRITAKFTNREIIESFISLRNSNSRNPA